MEMNYHTGEMEFSQAEELHGRISELIGADMLVLIEHLRDVHKAYKKQQAYCESIDHGRKHVIGTIFMELRRANEKTAIGTLEHEARAHPRYKKYLEQMRDAKSKLAELEAEYWALRGKIDYLKSSVMFHQTELRTLGAD